MTDTLGHRHIFGVLIPDMNSVVQPELDSLRPSGVTNQVMRYTPSPEDLSSDLVERAEQLLACKPNSLILGLTTDALPGGLDTLARKAEALTAATGLPVVTGSAANFAALRALGAERVALVTPFDDATNETVRRGYEGEGFVVTDIKGLACPSLEAIAQTPIQAIHDLVDTLDHGKADAIAQVGTALPVVAQIDGIERALGKPLVACNAAAYWQALRGAGLDDRIPGYGQLLNRL